MSGVVAIWVLAAREPKPTALKVLHGDRSDRFNREEPLPPESEVSPPAELSDDARAVWDPLARA